MGYLSHVSAILTLGLDAHASIDAIKRFSAPKAARKHRDVIGVFRHSNMPGDIDVTGPYYILQHVP